MWLGTDLVFEAFTFHIVESDWGVFQLHSYPYDDTMSTFIVETDEVTWHRAGLGGSVALDLDPGENDEDSIEFCRGLFADVLDGHELIGNNSKWLHFDTVRNLHWHDGNVVLLGDAAHTAHFSIGSGTKLAMEDAIALAWAFKTASVSDSIGAVLQRYEDERRVGVASTQRAAQASLEWFENISRYVGQGVDEFAFNLLTRSRRITYANLRMRDERFMDTVDRAFAVTQGVSDAQVSRPPMFYPFRLRDLELANRVVVSPMDMYAAEDGNVGDFHLVHLGSRGIGGAGLVMTEMLCVSKEGRITPRCAGLYRDDHMPGWRRIVDFVHTHAEARIGCQIGHSGRKGATKVMWEGDHVPLEEPWALVAPSSIPYFDDSPVPRELDRAGMDKVRDQFVAAANRADGVGFDLLEITWLTAICCRASCHRSPTGAPTSTEANWRIARASPSRCSTLADWPGRRPNRCRCASLRWTGTTAASPMTTRLRSRACWRSTGAIWSTSPAARSGLTRSRHTGAATRHPSPIAFGMRWVSRRWPSARSRVTRM